MDWYLRSIASVQMSAESSRDSLSCKVTMFVSAAANSYPSIRKAPGKWESAGKEHPNLRPNLHSAKAPMKPFQRFWSDVASHGGKLGCVSSQRAPEPRRPVMPCSSRPKKRPCLARSQDAHTTAQRCGSDLCGAGFQSWPGSAIPATTAPSAVAPLLPATTNHQRLQPTRRELDSLSHSSISAHNSRRNEEDGQRIRPARPALATRLHE